MARVGPSGSDYQKKLCRKIWLLLSSRATWQEAGCLVKRHQSCVTEGPWWVCDCDSHWSKRLLFCCITRWHSCLSPVEHSWGTEQNHCHCRRSVLTGDRWQRKHVGLLLRLSFEFKMNQSFSFGSRVFTFSNFFSCRRLVQNADWRKDLYIGI